MIALTQEKREELANYARARLASHVVHGGCSDEEDIFKIALASLTAEPVLYAVDSDVEDKIYTALCNENEGGAYPLFTAPPVPEIKFPDTDIFNALAGEMMEKSLNTNGKAAKAYSESAHRIAMKAKEFRDEIKRLNGLGE